MSGRGIVEAEVFRSEQVSRLARTSDPLSPSKGDTWIRTDVQPVADSVAALRIQGDSGHLEAPLFDPSVATGSNVYVGQRFVFADGTEGHLLVTDKGGAVGSPRVVTSTGTLYEAHNSLEVTVIPDSGNLKARYDARELSKSDGASVSTWPDESGNGNDLSMSGTVNYRDESSSNFSGVPSLDFENGYGQVTFGSAISPPYHVFYLGKYNSLVDFEGMWGTDGDEWKAFTVNSGKWRYDGKSGEKVEIGSTDTNSHIFNHRMQDDNPSLRIDGGDVGGGSLTINDESQLTVGTNPANTGSSSDTEFVEILVYSVDEESAGNETDIESYLDRDTSLI